MRRWGFPLAGLLGLAVYELLLPYYTASQPRNLSITRGQAVRIADEEARKLGIPLEKAWQVVTWEDSPIL